MTKPKTLITREIIRYVGNSLAPRVPHRKPITRIVRCVISLYAGSLVVLAAVSAAEAQTSNSTVNLAPTQAVDAAPVEHLLGDWAGLQPTLQSQGVNVQFDALTEFAGNVSGGTRQGSTFASQVGLNNDINWERLAGLTGLSTHVIIVSRSGANDSALFGDNLLPVQEIYGSGGNVVLHLVSVFAEETLYDKALDIAAGRMNVENDFASSPLYCNYMNNELCGDPKALPGGDIGHSAYPDAAWALRVRVRPTADTYIESGVYQVNQGMYSDANFRTGFKFDDSQTSGVYLPVEIAWEPKLGADQMPGHYKFGFGYDTSSGYQDFANALAADGVPGYRPHNRTGNTQVWALFDQMLLRQGSSDMDGIITLAGFIDNDPNHTSYAQQYFAGVIDGDFWQARPEDSINLLFTYVTASGPLGKVQAVEQSLGLPISGNATGIQNHEITFEANYNLHVFRGVDFQPDFQYIIQPNAQASIKDATVFGFRANVQF